MAWRSRGGAAFRPPPWKAAEGAGEAPPFYSPCSLLVTRAVACLPKPVPEQHNDAAHAPSWQGAVECRSAICGAIARRAHSV